MTNELEKNSRWPSIALILTLKVKQINALGLFAAVMFRYGHRVFLKTGSLAPLLAKNLLHQIDEKHSKLN